MSLQGIFNTGVQAMNTQSQMMSNISTNIANVNTTGYKSQDSHFQTLLNEVVVPGDKTFFAVRPIDYRTVDKQGIIATTQRNFDMALNGRGFIVTNPTTDATGQWQYTRDGAMFGKATELTTDTDGDGVNDKGTLLTTASGNYVYGWAADKDGNFSTADDLTTLTPIMINNNSVFPSQATTSISLQANLSTSTSSGRQTVGLPFVDASGNARTLSVGFTPNTDGTSGFTLDMASVDSTNSPVTVDFDPPQIAFDGLGNITTPSDGKVTAIVNDTTGPQAVAVDLTHLTQLGEENKLTVQNIDQDGYQEGRLNNTYFNQYGVLIGSYSNGEVRNLYKMPVANFNANENLEAKSGNYFVQSKDAGDLHLKELGSPTATTQFVVGALKSSNVDLTDQFSKMIVTQRAYSSAATVVRTADEMTQAVRDLKR